MSYILDALKKAESERKAGAVPGIHTQPPTDALVPDDNRATRAPLLAGGALLAAIALASLAWFQPWSSEAPPQSGKPAASGAAASAGQAAAPTATPSAAADAAKPASATAGTGAARPAAPAAESTPPLARNETSPPAPEPLRAAPGLQVPEAPPKPRAEPAPARDKPPQPEPAAPGNSRQAERKPANTEQLPTLQALPEHLRREIPALTVNGYLYSPNKADRTVLINQRLLREGDQVAPDLILESLTPSGMVLNYRGTRYRAAY